MEVRRFFPSPLAFAVLAGTVAAVLVFAATRPYAPGLSLDAVTYVGTADALVHTGELRVPFSRWADPDTTAALAHWPPGLSLLIAAPHAVGVPLMAGARAILILSALATVLGLALLVQRIAGMPAAVIASVLVITSPDLARLHTSIWSEPPFLVCIVGLVFALVFEPDRPLVHGVLAAIGVLLRYAGIALAAAAGLWALMRPNPWRTRIRSAVIAVLPGFLVQLWWTWRTTRQAGSIRSFAFYRIGHNSFLQATASLRNWLAPLEALPRQVQGGLALLMAIGGIAMIVLAVRRLRATRNSVSAGATEPEARFYTAAALLCACYIAVIIAARMFADPWIPFDGRMYSSVILLAEAAVAVALSRWWPRATRSARTIATIVLTLWATSALASSVSEARLAMNEGRYMTYGYWRFSGVLDWVRRDGRRVPIYSNFPSAVYMYANRSARETPSRGEVSRLREFGATLSRTKGVFVAFDMPSPWLVPNEPLAHYLALREVARFPDGAVWAASDSTPR
jgi:hypothetical protein